MKDVGRRLRWVREAYGLSQEQVAAMVGVSQAAWSLYEKGQRIPDQFKLPTIAGKLKITLSYLLTQELHGVERPLATVLAQHHPELQDNGHTGLDRDNSPESNTG